MPLTTGARFGPYEIVSAVGFGGMGEVYRARDTTLGRDVALKLLPEGFRADAHRLARFEREARSLAALNHPNIAAIYGVEEQSGVRALVLELVEGETLDERLGVRGSGPALPVAAALAIARQIVEALETAHDRGIIHRDLKPANIKITPAGIVKVLDFGLAKAVADDVPDADLSHSPTILPRTQAGVILGTAAYMSPEQARGTSVDKRADIWAFGCVLYEMLTGCASFPGDTVSDIIVSVLDREPNWNALPPGTPAPLVRLLHRSLAKDPNRRLRDIGDARWDLDEAQGGVTDGVTDPSVRSVPCDISFQRLTDFAGLKETPAVSPDGKMVAFVGVVGGKRQIWIRLLSGGALLQLTRDNAEHLQPRWAPDSNTLIYYTPSAQALEGTIWEISALGGWPRRVASGLGGGDISHDGRRIALLQIAEDGVALVAVARDGSGVERVALLPSGFTYAAPRWSPDDRWIALLRIRSLAFEASIDMIASAGGEWREVVRVAQLPGFGWLPDGSGFAYSSAKGSTLLYPPVFNLRTVARDGSGDRQLTFGDHSYVDPDVDRSGKLLVSRVRSRSDIWRIPVAGSPVENTRNAVRVTRQTGHVQTPTVSPDGTEVAYLSDNGGHANVWIASADGSTVRQITFDTDPAVSIGVPKWSPRGDLIAFVRNRSGFDPRGGAAPSGVIDRTAGLWGVCPDGSGLRQLVTGWAPCWSGDGKWLYYWWLGDVPRRLEKMPIDGGPAVVVREEEEFVLMIAVPADGSALYFVKPVRSNFFGLGRGTLNNICRARPESAPADVLFSIPGERIPVEAPGWTVSHIDVSPDGQWLATSLLDGGTSNLWALPTAGGPMKPLTDFGDRSVTIARSVSWSADSQHIYAAVAENDTDIVLIAGLIS